MKHYKAQWILQPISDTKTKVTFQSFIDLGGNAPVWLANRMGGGALHETFENMRERLKLPQYISSTSTIRTRAIYNCVLSGLCKDTLVK